MSEETQGIDSLYADTVEDPAAEPATPASTEPPAEPSTPPAEPATPARAGQEPTDPPADGDDSRSGMERFLADYGVEGGMVAFEDGEKIHISELSPAEQHVVFNSLSSKSRPTVEQEMELNDDEIKFINMVRESDGGVADVVADMANKQLDKIRLFEDSQQVDYDNMSSEAVYLSYLKANDSKITQEELESELEKVKDTKTFDTLVKGLRENAKRTQEDDRAKHTSEVDKKFNEGVEDDRRTIVADVAGIAEVAGFEVNDDHKNALLGDILELNDSGDSLLLEKIFSDPQSIFEAAWFQKYGKSAIDNMEKYWKQEVSKAFTRGRDEATGTMPGSTGAPRISGMRKRANTKANDGFNVAPDAKTVDDLYEDKD